MNDIVASVEDLTLTYGRKPAVRDLTFSVKKGTVCGFLGPNGAGKTTTIKALLGLHKPRSGTASVFGMNSTRSGVAIRMRTGYVAEERDFYPWMKASEIGWFIGGFYKTWDAKEYKRLLEQFGVDPAMKISAMSKGTKAKLSLALALGHRPAFLVLDEPTGGVDVGVRRQFLEGLVEYAAEGGTVLLASHLIADVERIAAEIVLINESRLVFQRDIEQLKEATKRVLLTFEGLPPAIDGEGVLSAKTKGRTCELIVRNFNSETVKALNAKYSPRSVEVESLSLEEIFLAYLPALEESRA